jgi:sulfite reductase (ferredoxin)
VRGGEAVLRVVDRLGQRRTRTRARIKFLVARLGIEELRRLVRRELQPMPPARAGLYRSPDFALEETPDHVPATRGRLPQDRNT